MITKEYGKFFGVCDLCDDATPVFDTFGEARGYVRDNNWQTVKDKETGEWEHYCPACVRKMDRQKALGDFESLDG